MMHNKKSTVIRHVHKGYIGCLQKVLVTILELMEDTYRDIHGDDQLESDMFSIGLLLVSIIK